MKCGLSRYEDIKYLQSQRLYAVYLTLHGAVYFSFFYTAIIREYKLLKKSSSCAVHELYNNTQLRYQLYRKMY